MSDFSKVTTTFKCSIIHTYSLVLLYNTIFPSHFTNDMLIPPLWQIPSPLVPLNLIYLDSSLPPKAIPHSCVVRNSPLLPLPVIRRPLAGESVTPSA